MKLVTAETFGEALRRLRGDLTYRAVASRAHLGKTTVEDIEKGRRRPSKHVVAALDAALNAGGQLIAAHEKGVAGAHPTSIHASVAEAGPLRTLENATPHTEEDDTDRRRLLTTLAAVTGAGILNPTGEPVRQLLDMTMGARSIEEWELACTDHLHALRTRPPLQVAADLLVDLQMLQHHLNASHERDPADLCRVIAAMATIHANALTRLGEHGAALRWWSTARRMADASGDLELRLGVRATEAGHNLYGQRSPEAVLQLTTEAQHLAGSQPSQGLALIRITHANALARLGRVREADSVLRDFRDLAAAAPPVTTIMPGYWSGGQQPFAESQVYAAAGDEKGTREAGQLVLASSSDYQVIATVKLHQALCEVVNGNIDDGMTQAASALDMLPARLHNHMVLDTARMVLRAVPINQRSHSAVGDLREMLSIKP